MASSGSTFSKMQREREKKERAAAKREKRQDRSSADAPETSTVVTGEGDLSASDLVRLVEAIHKEYEDGTIDLDEFEEKKQALLARVRID
ncbi:MAG TPA: hypothetical protein VM933_02330 [Acidimicrobiales bacterium]|nr:hypothetical protein [Acidimicrobiales bacterium]